ncbi:MAG: divergent polysaccharide deacetylase family protein [Syntrophobacteraceae bacterium]
MKRGTQPEKKKSPPVKRTRTGAKGRRKAGAPAKKPSVPGKTPPALLLAAWLIAVILLASVLYLSRDSGQQPLTTAADDSRQKVRSRSNPAQAVPATLPPSASGARKKTEAPPSKSSVPPEPDRTQHHGDSSAAAGKPVHTVPAPAPAVATAEKKTEAPTAKSPVATEPGGTQRDGSFSVAMNRPAPSLPAVSPPDLKPKPFSRIAIIIDDFGPDMEIAKKFASLPFHVSFSVLPHQAHSKEIIEMAHSRGRESLLHLPMEPIRYPKENPGKGAILLSMSRDDIQRNVRTALDASPHISGVNNHMGSRMTQNAEAMKTVLAELKQRDLFFVDSWTTAESKGWKIARELKIPTRKRDIFLDHSLSPVSIRQQIRRLIRMAKIQGTALAIGHPHEATLKSLQEAAAQFRNEGIEVVSARDLLGSR